MSRFRDYLDYYRRKLERNMNDETTIIQIIEKLNKTEFPVNDLLNSGIYKLVRSMGKSEGSNNMVVLLYNKWKMLILAAENDQIKAVQNSIPVQNRVSDRLENDVNDSFNIQPMDIQNGFIENVQKNAMHSASNIANFRPLRNQLPVNDIRMKSSTTVQPPTSDMGFKMKNSTPPTSDVGFKFRNSTPPACDIGFKFRNSTPPASDMGFKIRNSTPPASDMGFKIRNSTPPASDMGFKIRNSTPPASDMGFKIRNLTPPANDGCYKVKNLSPVQPPANNGGFKFKSSAPFEPSTNDGSFKVKSLTPVQPLVNKFQPFSNLSSLFPVHNVNTNENSAEQNTMPELSVNFDSHSNCSNALSSPHSSNSQNPLDIGSTNTSSPNKIGRIPDPYVIEMKEGMFRVVKCYDGLTPEIIRVKRLYNRDEDSCDIELEQKMEEILRTKNEQSPKHIKNSKSDKNPEKGHSSKSKNHSAEKSSKHKVNAEKHSSKTEKVKSAIDKSKLEKKVKEKSSESIKSFSPHNVFSKSSSKSSPAVKSSSKGSPSIKSSTKESPMKIITKGSPQVKSSTKGSPQTKSNTEGNLQTKSNTKGSPQVFTNHANPSSCDISRLNPAYKECDKRTNKVLPNETTDSFMRSKKERTSMYSGKKSFQEVPTLRSSCIRVLKKNIDCIKNTKKVPYQVLKPVLQCCSATQLHRIEEHNHYLLTNTEEIWKTLCQRKYRDMKPTSTGTWRNLYWKTREDQDKKLKNLTAKVSASMQKAAPERQLKLTLIESPERPRSKKFKHSVPEPKKVSVPEPKNLFVSDSKSVPSKESSSSHQSNSFKESNALSHKIAHKESSISSSHLKLASKESVSSGHKKPKKAPVAPLMSKVKKTILAMHKK